MSDIVEELRKDCEFGPDYPLDPESFVCHRIECKAADEIESLRAEITRLRDERRWIPVGERLPELLQNVLVCSSRGIHFASLDSRGQWLDEDENPGKKITHWQPLPPGPEANG